MATHYVDSAASGANDGTSWTDAWTSLASATGVADGSDILVDDGHSEAALSTDIQFSNDNVRVLCVDKADDSLSTGASITRNAADFRFSGKNSVSANVYVYGLTLSATSYFHPQQNSIGRMTFEQCSFGKPIKDWGPGAIPMGFNTFLSCDIDAASSYAIDFYRTRHTILRNCTISNPGTYLCKLQGGSRTAFLFVYDSDLSGFTTGVWDISNSSFDGKFGLYRCKVKSSPTWVNGTYGNTKQFIADSCDDGTISVPPLGLTYFRSEFGEVESSLSQYRTGGADDGEQANAYSFEMASNANALELYNPLEITLAKRWVDTGSQTITVYVASGTTLQDDEFWVEVSSPDEGGSPTAQGTYQTTRAAPQATPANLTTDSGSTWNGSGVGTKQKIDVSINPAVAGLVEVKAFLAKPSTTIYVDPKIGVA